MIEIQSSSLLQEVYMLYQVEPNKIPQEIPSTGEVIGYDIEYPEWNELKAYKMIDFLLRMRYNLSMDCDEELYCININKNGIFYGSVDDESLDVCVLKLLLEIHDKILEAEQQAIRDELRKEC